MARGLNLESARVRPAPADAPSRAGTCLAGTCLARPRRAHSRPPAPLPGLPPSRRAGPPPGHRGAPSPTPPRAPDARPAARAQQCPHLGTPATFRTASGNEIKSLGCGGGVPPNNRGGGMAGAAVTLAAEAGARTRARPRPAPTGGGRLCARRQFPLRPAPPAPRPAEAARVPGPVPPPSGLSDRGARTLAFPHQRARPRARAKAWAAVDRAGQPGPRAPRHCGPSPVEGELLPAVAVAVAALPGRA